MGKKPLIELWEGCGCGLIVPWQSGCLWSNQAGGTMCAHPECEGIFIPCEKLKLGGRRDPLLDYAGAYLPNLVAALIAALDAENFLRPLTWDEVGNFLPNGVWKEPDQLYEAWVPVIISAHSAQTPSNLRPFLASIAVITYENSD